jgi:hypothetical protein
MREIAEFRVVERNASLLFSDDEGKKLSDTVRKVEISTKDPRFVRIGEIQAQLRASNDESFFYGWDIRRKYSKAELKGASLLNWQVWSVFEPAGEECGTVYDESTACPSCGAGANQVGPLILDLKRIPKGRDFSQTIAGEIVVSKRVVDLFVRDGIGGIKLSPVHSNRPSHVVSKDWFHLQIENVCAEVVPPTRAGIDPFDEDKRGECRCAAGDLIGLNLLSEITISSASLVKADFLASRQFVGVRRGLLRPRRIVLVSPRVYQLISSENLKGARVEVAHVGRGAAI